MALGSLWAVGVWLVLVGVSKGRVVAGVAMFGGVLVGGGGSMGAVWIFGSMS